MTAAATDTARTPRSAAGRLPPIVVAFAAALSVLLSLQRLDDYLAVHYRSTAAFERYRVLERAR